MKKTTLFLLVVLFVLSLAGFQPAHSLQTALAADDQPTAINPGVWQTSAQGMKASQYGNVGGLGSTVNIANGWPTITLHGGVDTVGYESMSGPVGIPLGEIAIPGGAEPSSATQVVDWAKNEITAGSLKLWATRTSPALLVQVPNNQVRLFSGSVTRRSLCGNDICSDTGATSPKYVAYATAGGIQRATLGSGATSLSGINQNWLLVWYGTDSHFVETKTPTSYSGPDYDHASLPVTQAYQGDAPMLLLFQKAPSSIQKDASGGIQVTLAQASSYIGILPVLGRDHPRASVTEAWRNNGLPADVAAKIQWWAGHLCSYPVTASESYGYNAGTDTASITENITFLDNVLCAGGTRFAPIPPMVGIVKDSLGVSFSGTAVNANLPTEFGPTFGIEGVSQYTWSVSGLAELADNQRTVGSGTAPADLEQELEAQVQRIIAAGHMAPWVFMDDFPINPSRGALYWANPADSLYHLIEIAEALPAGATKSALINYIRTERSTYPPETTYDLAVKPKELGGTGTARTGFAYYGLTFEEVDWYWANSDSQSDRRADEHLQDVPLYNFYALSRYYQLTGESVPASVMTQAQTVLDRDMREQDWASSYWFYGYQDRRISVVNATRHFAGMLGYVRLADKTGDASEATARALLAKAAVTRLGMMEYPRYLSSAGLVELPARADWQPYFSRERWRGHLFNSNWTTANDDARQVFNWDQHEVFLYDHSGNQRYGYDQYEFIRLNSPSLIGYRDMVPELAKLFSDSAKNEALIYADKFAALAPHWYAAFGEAIFGMEHNLNHPIDSFQVFMAKAWIGGETPDNLAHYADIPWLQTGDLFYVQKLAETVRAYRGSDWGNTLSLSGSARDRVINLNWTTGASFPAGSTYRIEYTGPAGDQASPITGIAINTTAYTLTGLTNFTPYTIQVKAIGPASEELLASNTISITPTNRFIFLPVVRR
jgi:hypothetical protein